MFEILQQIRGKEIHQSHRVKDSWLNQLQVELSSNSLGLGGKETLYSIPIQDDSVHANDDMDFKVPNGANRRNAH